jgi:hypothetical protein
MTMGKRNFMAGEQFKGAPNLSEGMGNAQKA